VTLERDRLSAVAAIWKSQRRQLAARFGGTSMLPTIEPGVEVLIDCGREPKIGDVVLAVAPIGLIVHRLIIISSGFAVMRGDGTVVPDPAVPLDAIFGVVLEKRDDDQRMPLAAAPRSLMRTVFGALARVSLRFGYRFNHQVSRILWLGRSGALAFTGRVEVEDDREGDKPERE
jgi:hypothetical protein